MSDNSKKIEFKYHVCAVLFGTDETILRINLTDGFSFVRRSLLSKDQLTKTFDLSDIGLRRVYETARIDNNTLDVICIEKDSMFYGTPKEASEFYDNQVDADLVSLDNHVRALRLLKECGLRYKTVSFSLYTDEGEYGSIEYTSLIPISESFGSPEISKFHCEPNEVLALCSNRNNISFPFPNKILNIAHRFYDRSYLEDNYISLTLLIVSLEMLFLTEPEAKKVRLSKRCAMYMGCSKTEQIEYYNKMLAAYKKRSDFVHDGKFDGVDNTTILFLRNCVRTVLLNESSKNFSKTQFAQSLKKKVETAESNDPKYWGP